MIPPYVDRPKYFEECANTLERYLTPRYRIPVITFDVKDPFTGDLDGREIHTTTSSRRSASFSSHTCSVTRCNGVFGLAPEIPEKRWSFQCPSR
jgi:hypothetical protein